MSWPFIYFLSNKNMKYIPYHTKNHLSLGIGLIESQWETENYFSYKPYEKGRQASDNISNIEGINTLLPPISPRG